MRKQAILWLSLSLLAPASAQTLMDTSAAIGISNTLNQGVMAPSLRMPELPIAAHNAATEKAVAQAAMDENSGVQIARPSAPVEVAARPAPPLTAAQSEELRAALGNLSSGSYAAAQQGFERLIAQNFLQPEPHFGLAVALLEQGRIKAARFELEQLLTLAPERYEAPYNLGVLSARSGDNVAALGYFAQAAGLVASEDASVQLMVLDALAGAQTRAADYAALGGTLEQMYALAPTPALALRLARVQTLNGAGAPALPLAYEALSNPATRADAAALLADIYVAQGLPDRAISELEAALQAEEGSEGRSVLLTRRAALLAALGRADEAKSDALQATRLNPENAAAYAQLGALRSQEGNTSAALAAYREAARLSPTNGYYRTELGLTRLAAGQKQAARNDALLALKMADPLVQARAELLLGLIAYQNGSYAQAVQQLRSSLAKAPSAQASYWLGLAAYEAGDYATSAQALGQSAQLDPQPDTRVALGNALIAAGNMAEAATVLQEVTTETPARADAWYLLGLSQREMGLGEQARKSFARGAELGDARARRALQ